jgi:autotransporter-associated beta strand protein
LGVVAAERPVAATTFTWNTGSGVWDTTTSNWTGTGSLWVDGNDALFTNSTSGTSTISLNQSVTAGSVLIGDGGRYAFSSVSGSLLSAGSVIVQGDLANGQPTAGTVTTLQDFNLNTTGDFRLGRWALVIGGNSVVNVGGVLGGTNTSAGSADWGVLTIQDSAVVTATGGVNGNAEAWALNLSGGTLITPSIQASDREGGGNARLTFNGTTIKATTNNASFITVGANFLSTNSALVGDGGFILDTQGFNVGTAVNLNASGSGGLTKYGAGTFTLTGANTYTGATSIWGGTLQLGNGTSSNGTVSGNITNNATLAFANPTAQTYAGTISGAGALTKSGAGTLTLTGAHTFNGTTTVSAGSLNLSHSLALQNSTLSSGGIVFDASVASRAFALGGSTPAPTWRSPTAPPTRWRLPWAATTSTPRILES